VKKEKKLAPCPKCQIVLVATNPPAPCPKCREEKTDV
jgi:rubrerythrin